MGCQRMQATGRITNYEMEYLREKQTWRKTRWHHVWASVSDKYHATSLADWQAHLEAQED